MDAGSPEVTFALISRARCWLALAALTGAIFANSPGTSPKNSNDECRCRKCPDVSDDPAYAPADVPTTICA